MTYLTKNFLDLTKKDAHYRWTSAHKQEWIKVEKMLKELSHITLFKIGDNTKIFCDASRVGLSYVMTQVRPSRESGWSSSAAA